MGHAQSADLPLKHLRKSSNSGSAFSNDGSSKFLDTEKQKQTRKLSRNNSIRQKLSKTLRPIKSCSYSKQMQDLLQSWSINEIQLLLRKYETLEAVRELKFLSDSARCINGSIQSDFHQLFYGKYLTDIVLEYKETLFPVHKILLISRCQYFRNILLNENQRHVKIDNSIFDVNVSVFMDLLCYIYCGNTNNPELLEVLSTLGEKFGLLNSLENDMQKLLISAESTDLVICYRNNSQATTGLTEVLKSFSFSTALKVPCHLSIVCSRSPFLKRLFENKYNNQNELIFPLVLEISEQIIPQPYLQVVIECIYFDQVNFNSIFNAKHYELAYTDQLSKTETAMKVFEIGQFLEMPSLMRGCEDFIVRNLSVLTLINILEWSSVDSNYVYRQATQFLREEFITLCKSTFFIANLPKKHLLEVLDSDFLQADEEILLDLIIAWGEWQIVKALGNTNISPSKSLPRHPSLKRCNITNDALSEMITSLVSYVRLRHILPQNSPILSNACQRGLIQMPLTTCDVVSSEKKLSSAVYWVQELHHSDYVKPRLFLPFLNEAKLIYQERLSAIKENSNEIDNLASIPSTVLLLNSSTHCTSDEHLSVPLLDIFQLSNDAIKNIVMREKELKSNEQVLKYLKLAPDNVEIISQIQLRAVREFDYPDELANEIFQHDPDLVEDFVNAYTKQSTLSKVGHLMPQLFCLSRKNIENNICDNNLKSNYSNDKTELSKLTLDDGINLECITNADKEACLLQLPNHHSSLIDDCPLDLPLNAELR